MKHIIKMLALGVCYDTIRPYCFRKAETELLDIIEESWSPALVRECARVHAKYKDTKSFISFILKAV